MTGGGQNRHIAVIGAGMAGAAAARRLGEAGVRVTLYDKSRGLGGRMATRRADTLRFDHGAQYFTARGDRFRTQVANWVVSGVVAEWFSGGFVGTPGMSAPAKALAAGRNVVNGCRIETLKRNPAGWFLHPPEDRHAAPATGPFAAVILAVPAPQAIPLAASADIAFAELSEVVYAPCWALMLAFDRPLGLSRDRFRFDTGPLSWVARNTAKPGRDGSGETLVVHASPDWSRVHLELEPEAAADFLLPQVRLALGLAPDPTYIRAHRWRYALVETAAGAPCLWDDTARIGACGDWAIGPRVEAAFDSGEAMADRVIAALGGGNDN